MSAVYSAGVKATAIAAIKAAINARITTAADGAEVLNTESLTAWLRAEFDDMITDAEANSASYVAGIDCAALTAGLNNVIRREAFNTRADWPSTQTTVTPAVVGAAVREHLAELQRLSAEVTAFYANTAQKVADIVLGYIRAEVEPDIPDGVVRIVTTAAVIATYVTDRGEESAPSPVSLLFNRDQNDTFEVTVPAPPSGRDITHFRLYLATTTSSAAAYLLIPNPDDVDGWPIADLTVSLDVADEELQEPCPSTTWEVPPDDFRGLVSMGNGIHVGFSGNTIIPSEPYKPYAFPPEYRKTTSHPIVGLLALDQVLLVGTQGPPKLLAGADSASLSEIRHNSGQACVSARSMVAIGDAGIYASPDGLVLASANGFRLITGPEPEGFGLFSKEDWLALTPASIFAAELEGAYVFHVPAGYCYCLDLRNGKLTKLSVTGSAFYRDQLTDTLYLASGTAITALFNAAGHRTAIWKSKRIVLPKYTGFGWLQVNSDFESTVTVRLYLGGTLHSTKTVSSLAPVRLEPGLGIEWEVELESAARVTSVTLASSIGELRLL